MAHHPYMRTPDGRWRVEVVTTRTGQHFRVDMDQVIVRARSGWLPTGHMCFTVAEVQELLGEAFAELTGARHFVIDGIEVVQSDRCGRRTVRRATNDIRRYALEVMFRRALRFGVVTVVAMCSVACSSSGPQFPDIAGNGDQPSAKLIANTAGCDGYARWDRWDAPLAYDQASCNFGPTSRGVGIAVITSNSQYAKNPHIDAINNDLREEEASMKRQGIGTIFMVGHHFLLEYWYNYARPTNAAKIAARVGAHIVKGAGNPPG